MEQMRKNYQRIGPALKQFLSTEKELISDERFYRFLSGLEINIKAPHCEALLRLLDFRREGSFPTSYFLRSYASFTQYEQIFRTRFEKVVRHLYTILRGNYMV
jgi:hypothetical protein